MNEQPQIHVNLNNKRLELLTRVKQFSHTDLDGWGSIGVAQTIFGQGLEYEACDYHDIDEKVQAFLNLPQEQLEAKYDLILITDISVNEKVAEQLEYFHTNSSISILLIDHHLTSTWLSDKYQWANTEYEREAIYVGETLFKPKQKTSAAWLLFDKYINAIFHNVHETTNTSLQFITKLVENIRLWDTFEWTEEDVPLDKSEPFILQTIFTEYGPTELLAIFKRGYDENRKREAIAKIEKIKEYIDTVSQNVTIIDWKGYRVGVVFAESNTSLLGNKLHEAIKDKADFVCIVNLVYRRFSLRTTDKSINLGLISKKYLDGGGHPPAAGAQMSLDLLGDLAHYVMEKKAANP